MKQFIMNFYQIMKEKIPENSNSLKFLRYLSQEEIGNILSNANPFIEDMSDSILQIVSLIFRVKIKLHIFSENVH